jgi:hypothetical protein
MDTAISTEHTYLHLWLLSFYITSRDHKKTEADLCEEYNFYNIRMHTISLNSPIVFLILFIYGEVIYGYLNGNPCHYDYLWKINLKSTC